MQKSMRERNCHMYCLLLLADVVHYLVTSAAYRRTHLLCRHWTINRSPHQHSSRHWLEAPAGSSTKKLAATSGRRHWPICWCCPDRGPGSFDVEDATTLSWSSAAVSEWVSEWVGEVVMWSGCCLMQMSWNNWYRPPTTAMSASFTLCLQDLILSIHHLVMSALSKPN